MTECFYDFAGALQQIEQQHLYRRRRIVEGAQQPVLNVDGHPVINFCSNDYLGLANHPEVAAAFKRGIDRYGVGSGSAHLVSGHSAAHHALEEALADFTGRERALVFSTGYMANLGVISALVGRHDRVLEDRLNHASLIDGGLLSRAQFKRYRHADAVDLALQLSQTIKGKSLIVTDGVFSMDGDLAPFPELISLSKQHGAGLLIDDAHGFGVLGATGGGIVEHWGLSQSEVPILMGTLGKAFGTFGAFVAGSEQLIEFLIQKARSYIFTTALPPAIAEATLVSLRLLREESWRRQHLKALIQHFKSGAERMGLALSPSETAIQPLLLGDSERANQASAALLTRGLWVSAIRPPTVPCGTARLRITFSAQHELSQIDRLLEALGEVLV